MLISLFIVYTTSDVIGSSDRMWDLLKEASVLHPVDGNAGGEYLTMRSQDGAYIGLVLIGAGFAASVDSQLFQKAIAADPRSTSMGYILGGLSWFTIPFVLASTFGIVAAGAEHLPQFPTYPNRMTADEVAAGMAMPYAAMTVMGTGGVVAVLLMIFMAVTSAMSSETVATTALLAYNLYKAYIHPNATSDDIMRFSHWATPGFAVVAAAVAVGFNHVSGFSVGFLIVCVGIVVDSMIVPMACTIMWKKQSKLAAILSPVLGSCLGLLAWFVKTKTEQGVINITTLNAPLPLAAGNMVSLCSPIILTPLITYIKPDNFDWNIFHTKIKRDDEEAYEARGEEPQLDAAHDAENQTLLLKARNRAIFISVFLTLAFCLLWPIPMYGTGYIFSRGFFKGWVVVLFFWGFFAAGVITLLPIWEGKDFIRLMYKYFKGSYVPPNKNEVVEGQDTAESSEKGVTIADKTG
ncbi:putative urea active transporter protein [Phaeoacremonium minimum UCRPA7]|uniref:Putative urea active transporter protein n=1 Tax=Phaeoacremonium minimum (strain UCR-PA7) TaxID=1286976 RepID=R8BGD5_PHAM7|nr:putative urea active transporter protein [Phaeoacremonium minimum UCRPA7]EON98385.1 putative urea active transporter protein [Phaeoacremonium minimum UCRPA7]